MNGILLIDKEAGMTSRDVVDKASRLLGTKKIGHTGTLDPLATGVLVLCVGNATKIVDLITSYDKKYIAEIIFGIETDTLDIEGTILNEVEVNITTKEVNEALKSFIGSVEQEVPKYSAIKVKGRRLYDYARNNVEIELPKRDINIYDIKLIDDVKIDNNKSRCKIECHVSKGTYIRSLIRDIGVKLGVPACMSSLRRITQGNFKINDCYTIQDIEKGNFKLLRINEALDLPMVKIDDSLLLKIRNGNPVKRFFDDDKAFVLDDNNEIIAIYQTDDNDQTMVKPFKMLI